MEYIILLIFFGAFLADLQASWEKDTKVLRVRILNVVHLLNLSGIAPRGHAVAKHFHEMYGRALIQGSMRSNLVWLESEFYLESEEEFDTRFPPTRMNRRYLVTRRGLSLLKSEGKLVDPKRS